MLTWTSILLCVLLSPALPNAQLSFDNACGCVGANCGYNMATDTQDRCQAQGAVCMPRGASECDCIEAYGAPTAQTNAMMNCGQTCMAGCAANTYTGCLEIHMATYCLCIPPHIGKAESGGALQNCELDECNALCPTCVYRSPMANQPATSVCAQAGQLCTDPDKTTTGNWRCVALFPYQGDAAGAPVDTTQPANLITNAPECSTAMKTSCGNNQVCQNPANFAGNDQMATNIACKCVAPLTGSAMGKTATCILDECLSSCPTCADNGGGNICHLFGQMCRDPNTSPTSVGDWECVCPGGTTTNKAAPVKTCTPTRDQCKSCFDQNQMCLIDPKNANAFTCQCPYPFYGTGASAAATCELDECAANCPSCAGDTCRLYGQDCVDTNKAANSLRNWECRCPGATTGQTGRPDVCGTNPCTPANAATCLAQGRACKVVGATFECSCVLPATVNAGKCEYDECTAHGTACPSPDQECVDRNKDPASLGDWECVCKCDGCTGSAVASRASCVLDECASTCATCAWKGTPAKNTCYAAGQSCNDKNTAKDSTGDWECICPDGTTKGDAAAATCPAPVGECAVNQGTCTAHGQQCKDPNPNSPGDWTCNCLVGVSTGGGVAAPNTCELDECTAVCPTCAMKSGSNVCAAAGQKCVDLNTNAKSLGDWMCNCTTGVGIEKGKAAVCKVDECTVPANLKVCSDAGQMCNDPSTTPTSLNDWQCTCPTPATGTPGDKAPAAKCDYPTANPCATAAACPAGQYCTDAGGKAQCTCLPPFSGVAPAMGACNVIDECTAACETCENDACGASAECYDPDKTVFGNWICTCKTGKGSKLAAPPSCEVDECQTNAKTCWDVGQECVDTNMFVPDTWYCRCIAPATGMNVKAPATCTYSTGDECETNTACKKVGKGCKDPNPSTPNDATCECIPPAKPKAGKESCELDECQLPGNAAICQLAQQTCIDLNTAQDSMGNWGCRCQSGTFALKMPAKCVLDECSDTTKATVCTSKGQLCEDSNKDPSFLGDWECVCPNDNTKRATAGAVTDCGMTECTANEATCIGANQYCVDPSATAGDWTCKCHAPQTGEQQQGAAKCVLDECTATCATCATNGNGNICTLAGQKCVDPDPSPSATGNWYCECSAPALGTAEGKAADCVLDECAQDTTCSAAGQKCVDPVKDPNVKGDWQCECFAPQTGPAVVGGVATCTHPSGSECATKEKTCKDAGQICKDPSTASDDWVCECPAPTTGTAVKGAPATCELDECVGNTLCGNDQTCVDLDKSPKSKGDWICTCTTGIGSRKGGRAACVLDECTDAANAKVCSDAGQQCKDVDTSPTSKDNWQCVCLGGTGTPVTKAPATCTFTGQCQTNAKTCTDKGQFCREPVGGSWECVCPSPLNGSAPQTAATCVLDECTIASNSDLCKGANQTCVDPNMSPNSQGDWKCRCVSPSTGEATKAPAQCGRDECVTKGSVCSDAGQKCRDPNTQSSSTDDWVCDCVGTTGSAVAKPATCAWTGECVNQSTVCTSAGLTCEDPSPLINDDWRCLCVAPKVNITAGRQPQCGDPQVDECADATNSGVCTKVNQLCFDPDKTTMNDWQCVCPAGGNPGIGVPAPSCTATVDECTAVCGTCANTGSGNVCEASGQTCEDVDKAKANSFECVCSGGAKGEGRATGAPAVCEIDECKGTNKCAPTQRCLDTNKGVNSLNDYTCFCNATNSSAVAALAPCDECDLQPCGTGQTCSDPSPTPTSGADQNFKCTCANGVEAIGKPAACTLDECAASPCSRTGTRQTCVDTNQVGEAKDFVCTCDEDGQNKGKTATGSPVNPCGQVNNECAACPGAAPGCPCGADQECIDQNTGMSSTGDFMCLCKSSINTKTGGRVADCGTAVVPRDLTPLPAPPPAVEYNRHYFRITSSLTQATYSAQKVLEAIIFKVNRYDNGSVDMQVLSCSECSLVGMVNIIRHCWEFDAALCPMPSTAERGSTNRHLLQIGGSNSAGLFEFRGPEGAKREWIAAMTRSESDLRNDPNVQLVDLQSRSFNIQPQQEASDSDDDEFPWWAILLIVVGVILLILLIILLYLFCIRKKGAKKGAKKGTTQEQQQELDHLGGQQKNSSPNNLNEAEQGTVPWEEQRPSSSYDAPGKPVDSNPIPSVFPAAGAAAAGGAMVGAGLATHQNRDLTPQPNSVVLGFGRNLEGQLGLGGAEDLRVQYVPVEIPDLCQRSVSLVSCGSFHTIVVLTDATVLGFGENSDGQLGLGHREGMKTPVVLPFFSGKTPRAVACGEQHTIIICEDGVYAFGRGEDGQLGTGTTEDQLYPARLQAFEYQIEGVSMVACGTHHTCYVVAGALYATGWNRYGQLGLGDEEDRLVPTEVLAFRGMEVIDVACGVQHTVVLTNQGVFAMGGNMFGQLGLGNQQGQCYPQRIAAFDGRIVKGISAWFHTLVLCEDGLYAFGEGERGKLGLSSYEDDEFQNVFTPQLVRAFSGKQIIMVHAGSEHSVVEAVDGLYIWGNGDGGKLGHGCNMSPVEHPISITNPANSRVTALHSYTVHQASIGVDHTIIYADAK